MKENSVAILKPKSPPYVLPPLLPPRETGNSYTPPNSLYFSGTFPIWFRPHYIVKRCKTHGDQFEWESVKKIDVFWESVWESNYKPVFSSTFDALPHQTGTVHPCKDVETLCKSICHTIRAMFMRRRMRSEVHLTKNQIIFFF